MTKQKILTFFLMVLPFGTGVSFMRCFMKNNASAWAGFLLAAGIVSVLVAGFFPKTRKSVLETAVKLQPLAAVVFTASFVLSFLPYSMMWPQLFSVLVLNTVCLCMAFDKMSGSKRSLLFGLLGSAVLIGACPVFFGQTGIVYIGFVLLSLLCRPVAAKKNVREIWKDIAFPLFVLVGSFVLFIAANHGEALPVVIAQSVVMLMIGGLLALPSSSLRLTLMTIVLMIFGSYVFSAQNAESVFNRSGQSLTRIERLF
ncbi:MAG: hypothetical protein J5787_05290 [Alphaproteobacteria bacterium]|nr:hypothetical protein [Alphaproteobacteria bacterium]